MSTISISGKVVYRPGQWGPNVPAASARVTIIDLDAPGRGDDTIWSGTTDANGNFQGTSSEWQDTIKLPDIWVPPSVNPQGKWVNEHWEGSGPLRHWVPGHWEAVTIPGHWETTPSITDPSDILALKAVVTQGSHTQEFFPFINNAPVPIVLPWGPLQITRDQRGLVAFTSVINNGIQAWRPLYNFLEAAGPLLIDTILRPTYKTVINSTGTQCTKAAFLSALQNLAADTNIMAIDVILNLHGENNKIWFFDGATPMADLKTQIQALNIGAKLRILYSGACYASSHTSDFVASGFDAASGAVAVTANQPVEYPTFLTLWGAGLSFNDAITFGENPVTRIPLDQIARSAGFSPVDSHKVVTGNGTLNINTI